MKLESSRLSHSRDCRDRIAFEPVVDENEGPSFRPVRLPLRDQRLAGGPRLGVLLFEMLS